MICHCVAYHLIICFIDDVHEINNQSYCILSGPPCISKRQHDKNYRQAGMGEILNWKLHLQFAIHVYIAFREPTLLEGTKRLINVILLFEQQWLSAFSVEIMTERCSHKCNLISPEDAAPRWQTLNFEFSLILVLNKMYGWIMYNTEFVRSSRNRRQWLDSHKAIVKNGNITFYWYMNLTKSRKIINQLIY